MLASVLSGQNDGYYCCYGGSVGGGGGGGGGCGRWKRGGG